MSQVALQLALIVTGVVLCTVSTISSACAAPHSTPHSSSVVDKSEEAVNAFGELANGISLCNAGKYKEAESSLLQYVTNFPKDPQGQFWLGTVYLDIGNFVQAETALRKGVALLPANTDIPELHVNLGNALLGQGKFEDALPEFNRAIAINPKEPRAHYNCARALLETRNPIYSSVALEELKTTEDLGLHLANTPFLKAKANIDLGRLDEAKNILASFLATCPNDQAHEEDRKMAQGAVESLTQEITRRKQEVPPTPAEKRHYELKDGTQYVIVDVDKEKHLVTMACSDRKDPDGGAQDGHNDGIIEMLESDLSKQVEGRGDVWRK